LEKKLGTLDVTVAMVTGHIRKKLSDENLSPIGALDKRKRCEMVIDLHPVPADRRALINGKCNLFGRK
jgi:hypothetical protein